MSESVQTIDVGDEAASQTLKARVRERLIEFGKLRARKAELTAQETSALAALQRMAADAEVCLPVEVALLWSDCGPDKTGRIRDDEIFSLILHGHLQNLEASQ